jgi:hypothetical protein
VFASAEEVPFVDEVALVEASNTFIEEEASGLLPSRAEIEDGIIPGRPLPEECHAEAHTDYDGAAVRWGLTHHVDSAADCCQACLDHARSAEGDSKKCNVWVYCPSEEGCYSPDIYEHKHQECWLKQVSCAIGIVLALQPSHFSAFGRCPFNFSTVRSAEKNVQMWA